MHGAFAPVGVVQEILGKCPTASLEKHRRRPRWSPNSTARDSYYLTALRRLPLLSDGLARGARFLTALRVGCPLLDGLERGCPLLDGLARVPAS